MVKVRNTPQQPPATSEKPQDEYPKHVGGGYYELSDGSRVRGKDAAKAAQENG